MPDINTLIQRWQAGDERAAEALYTHHRETVFRLAYGLSGDREDAEATTLAPHSILLLNERAMLQMQRGNLAGDCQHLERSLELDAEFEQVRQLYTNTCARSLPEQPQNLGFER